MDRYTMVVSVMGQLCGTALLITIISLWFTRRHRAPLADGDGILRLEQRLTEMQQSLDAVAVEVERISEGQRFATKLLAERGGAVADANGVPDQARRSAAR
jgi:hypothetical protein